MRIHIPFKYNTPLFIIALLFIMNVSFLPKGPAIFSPLYLTLIITIIFIFISLFFVKKISIPFSAVLAIIVSMYMLITQPFLGGKLEAFLGSAFSILTYAITIFLLTNLKSIQVYFIIKAFVIYNSILHIADFIQRYSVIGYKFWIINNDNFHSFKNINIVTRSAGTLGNDSAYIAIFLFYLYYKTKDKFFLYFGWGFVFFIISSLTRAALLGLIFAYILMCLIRIILKNLNLIKRYYINILYKFSMPTYFFFSTLGLSIFILTILILLFPLCEYFSTDGSFISKTMLFSYMLNFLTLADFNHLLFGAGYQTIYSYQILWIYAHTYLATYVVETGIIGYLLITSLLCRIFYEVPQSFCLLACFFFIGFSYIAHNYLNLFFMILAAYWYFERGNPNLIQLLKRYLK